MAEVDGVSGEVVAEYVPGPAYIDHTIAARRDLDRDGDFGGANEGWLYYLTDQQFSTVALLDASGAVIERYGYDAFGVPSFFDGNGDPIAESAVGNTRLYTGREWLPELGLYDYRQRLYNPNTGRFLTRDPVYDPANLGNPYTYVGNNPGAFVDPYGDALETVWDVASLSLGVASFGYNISQGHYLSASVDAVGIALDSVATVLPVIPGGAGVGIKAYRSVDIAFNAGQATASAIDAGVAVSQGDYTRAALSATGTVLQGTHAGVRVGQVRVHRHTDAMSRTTPVAKSTHPVPSTRAGTQLEFDFASPATPLEPGAFEVGLYRELKGKLPGYEAHHVGQQAVMKKFIPEYDPMNAPAILVPRLGHTRPGQRGMVDRSTSGLRNTRQLIARDIMELKRVYPEIPNQRLQTLIEMNRGLYGPYMKRY